MLWFTPDVSATLDWFAWTHTLGEQGWTRTTLPRAGGLADQPARLMLLLDVARATANQVTQEQIGRQRRQQDLAAYRAERDRERRGRS